jgi:beta-glucosidase
MTFQKADLAYWDVKRHGWVIENGTYEICIAANAADVRLTTELQIIDGTETQTPYSEEVDAAYALPPSTIPNCFEKLIGFQVLPASPYDKLTLESPLWDLRKTWIGRILYRSIMYTFQKDYIRAQKMPDSLERDTKLKNSYFVVKMMPHNSILCMCMSSSGKFSYYNAVGFVEMANGHLIKGLRAFLKKEGRIPLPKDT